MGKLKDSVMNYPVIKVQSTGDNDSIEDAIIVLMQIRDTDGLLVSFSSAYSLFKQYVDNMILSSSPKGFTPPKMEYRLIEGDSENE